MQRKKQSPNHEHQTQKDITRHKRLQLVTCFHEIMAETKKQPGERDE